MIEGTTARALEQLDARINDMRGQFQPGYVPEVDDDRKTTGVRAVNSLDNLHTTAPKDAYYVAVDSLGRRYYTRDGGFSLHDNRLETADGAAVLGFPANMPPGAGAQALTVDPVDGVLGRVSDPHVEADGTLAYTRQTVDPRNGAAKSERVVVGRVALARFAAGSRIGAVDGTHVVAPSGVTPLIGVPKSDNFGELLVHSDDRGGVDIQQGLSHLRDAFMAFNAMQSAHNVRGSTDKIAMDLIK